MPTLHNQTYAEYVIQAAHSADFLRQHLRGAFREAGPVEIIVLERLLEDAAKLSRTITQLQGALR